MCSAAPAKRELVLMKIAVTGAGGLVGSGLLPYLKEQGHEICPLVRRRDALAGQGIFWNPATGAIDRERLEGLDAVIHLAGENLSGYWSAAKKERIMSSRRDGTQLLSTALAGLQQPPKVLISASATGFYGDRGVTVLDESSEHGEGFLAEVCTAWEKAADSARSAGIRVVHSRFGIILDAKGGAMGKLLPLLRFGLGGKLGSGRQYWSWITIQDVHRALAFCLNEAGLEGAVNFTAPAPATNAEFTRTAAQFLHRPAFFIAPAFALRLLMGEMANEMLLSSARVLPEKLLAAGFQFAHPDLTSALPALIGAAASH